MEMTTEEEHKFILKELEWAKKIAHEKRGELEIATRQWHQAQFRVDITQKALDDFYEGNPEMNPTMKEQQP